MRLFSEWVVNERFKGLVMSPEPDGTTIVVLFVDGRDKWLVGHVSSGAPVTAPAFVLE